MQVICRVVDRARKRRELFSTQVAVQSERTASIVNFHEHTRAVNSIGGATVARFQITHLQWANWERLAKQTALQKCFQLK